MGLIAYHWEQMCWFPARGMKLNADDVHVFKCSVEDYLFAHADDYDERMMDIYENIS